MKIIIISNSNSITYLLSMTFPSSYKLIQSESCAIGGFKVPVISHGYQKTLMG